MTEKIEDRCPDELLSEIVTMAGADEGRALRRLQDALEAHPDDPRLHFLQGSLLAGQGRYQEAHSAMRHAVVLDPNYAIARFQLGLLELSSGDPGAADATLEPFSRIEGEEALALLALGLRHLARDEFDKAAELLRRGIAANREHPVMNNDMELVLAQIGAMTRPEDAPEGVSAAHLLLQQDAGKSSRH